MRSAIQLDKIANDVCISLGDTHFNSKLTVTNHLIDCYRDFSLYVGTEINVRTQCLAYGNAINLPKDFIYETKVGVRMNGRIAMLTLDQNRHSVTFSDSECRDYLSHIWDGEYRGEAYYFYNAPTSYGELYGYGRGVVNTGTYRINRRDGVIEIGSHLPVGCEIFVEYMSDSVEEQGLKVVPTEAKKMHEYFALSEMYMNHKWRNFTAAQINRNNYEMEFKRVKRLYNQRDPQQVIDSINAAFSPTNY